MQSHCLDPYGCVGSVMSMPFGLSVDLHGLEKVLASAQKPDFASLLEQNLCDGGYMKLPTGLRSIQSHCLDPYKGRACKKNLAAGRNIFLPPLYTPITMLCIDRSNAITSLVDGFS